MAADVLKPSNKAMPEMPAGTLEEALGRLNQMRQKQNSAQIAPTPEAPYVPGSGMRTLASQETEFGLAVGTGYSDLVQLRDDLLVRITHAVNHNDLKVTHPGENWLKLEFWMAGKVSMVFQDCGQIDFEGRWCFIHWHPEGVAKGEWIGEGEGIAVTVYCRPSYLRHALGDQIEQLPASMRDLAANGTAESLFEILPLTHTMANAVTDLINVNSLGNLRHLYVEAKTMELFAAAVEILFLRDEDQEHSTIKRLTRSEIRRVQEVRDHILKNLADPPKITDLCRQAGMNQQKLQQIFKALFNETISDFCVKKRMEEARKLLEQNEMTVTQVADCVGYEFANNFSTAFKRYFGILPKTYQTKFHANINVSADSRTSEADADNSATKKAANGS